MVSVLIDLHYLKCKKISSQVSIIKIFVEFNDVLITWDMIDAFGLDETSANHRFVDERRRDGFRLQHHRRNHWWGGQRPQRHR